TAGGGDTGHRDDDRFLFLGADDLAPDGIRGNIGSARAVDAQDDRGNVLIVGRIVNGLADIVRGGDLLAHERVGRAADDHARGDDQGDFGGVVSGAGELAGVICDVVGALALRVELVHQIGPIGDLID